MAGNLLGDRYYYKYTDDLGNDYKFLTDEDLGDAGNNEKDDTLDDLPRRFKPRGVYAQNDDGNRKFIIVGDPDDEVFASNSSQTLTIDGQSFKTTGRRGEQVSFGRNRVAATP